MHATADAEAVYEAARANAARLLCEYQEAPTAEVEARYVEAVKAEQAAMDAGLLQTTVI